MRNERVVVLLVASATLATAAGCVQEMANQPRVEPLEESRRADAVAPPRGPVPGTVARGHYEADEAFNTGQVAGEFVAEVPTAVAERLGDGELLARGHERFNIFCSHCHGLTGGGTGGDPDMRSQVGMVVKRGFPTPPTYHQPRLRAAPVGRIFDVITHGVGRMAAHETMIPTTDRWAIAAYVKALQFSQYAPRSDLSADDLTKLSESTQP